MPHQIPTITDPDTLAEIDALGAHPKLGLMFKSAWASWMSGKTRPATNSYGVRFKLGPPGVWSALGTLKQPECPTCFIGAALLDTYVLKSNSYITAHALTEVFGIDEHERWVIACIFDGAENKVFDLTARDTAEFTARVRALVIKVWGELTISPESIWA